jgi:hypothetical protein
MPHAALKLRVTFHSQPSPAVWAADQAAMNMSRHTDALAADGTIVAGRVIIALGMFNHALAMFTFCLVHVSGLVI